ncbi:3-deoxy-manno-octulosonate cytidylyltransferase [Flavobacterium cyanobacteriorum]|uniref:3-deoxy-manno-octulosonate cytidylyltransferase n=1 Tax=Flavobacterium cyanobacteriorum TaxID=2022802 RepID=A0A255Z5K7_9FLAO|nr:3-deoxy-manno-octulosonate cytidylyltransferase [Flavobacterium cyanobacteriorum]OYQ36729.1 3-deoxy-manno-octulosonate cytidylyltransferase [Flavobacterium cyanobacteriorum]
MNVIAVIPARYASTRFPAKLVQDLCGKPVIVRTYEAALQTQLFDEVFVVTDADEIEAAIKAHGGKVIRSQRNHESGSDRIAEAVADLKADIVVNVQGDEPFIAREPLEALLQAFCEDVDQRIDLGSLMVAITDTKEIENPNVVKVVTDRMGYALYFSRSVIPYPRERAEGLRYMRHIGVYAFRKQALLDFAQWPMQPLEATEKLEQLRYLEFGKRIKMVETSHVGIGIDTPEDLEQARVMYLRK